MSEKDNDKLITNQDTIVRRAWIETALNGARARLEEPLPPAESGSLIADTADTVRLDAHRSRHLRVVWDAAARRSGT